MLALGNSPCLSTCSLAATGGLCCGRYSHSTGEMGGAKQRALQLLCGASWQTSPAALPAPC